MAEVWQVGCGWDGARKLVVTKLTVKHERKKREYQTKKLEAKENCTDGHPFVRLEIPTPGRHNLGGAAYSVHITCRDMSPATASQNRAVYGSQRDLGETLQLCQLVILGLIHKLFSHGNNSQSVKAGESEDTRGDGASENVVAEVPTKRH